jgi:uncharacterized membrane protein
MSQMPDWVLTTAYSAHMLATVVWIGGITFQAALLLPLALKPETGPKLRSLLGSIRRRFLPLAWLSLAVLIGSGLTQMTASTNYAGFLVIQNRWSFAILLKHLGITVMLAVMAYQTWVLYPRWARLELIQARTTDDGTGADLKLLRHEATLIRVQLLLSVIVLILTAVARTA